ncbi:MAG: bifunctional diguanylate cyclase/phosphodiesterase [Clostridiales bacterium]|nr:bifunctional diguanylate cyclase/phosphodiesterase [Clostridiales bacterium]
MIKIIEKMNKTVIFTIISIILVLIWWGTINKFSNFTIESRDNLLNEEINNMSNQISKSFESNVDVIRSLKAFVTLKMDDGLSQELLDDYGEMSKLIEKGVININIAPNGIITYVYPLEDNKVVLRHDLINDEREEVRKDIEYSIKTKSSIISGPTELIRGGIGLIIRDPIFIDDEFWGFVTIVVDACELTNIIDAYNGIGLFNYALIKGIDEVFYGAEFSDYDLLVDVPSDYLKLSIAGELNENNNYFNNDIINFVKYISFIFLIIAIYIVYDITYTNKVLSKKIINMIYFDKLTGLPNRRSLEKKTLELMKNGEFYLIFADLDDFKFVNDAHGHSFGDVLLKQISNTLYSYLSKNITVYRWGGDEFVFTIEGESKEQVNDSIKEILSHFETTFEVENNIFNISVSMGIVHYPSDSDGLDDMIKKADISMYSIKESGKNGYVFFSEIDTAKYFENIELNNRMKSNEFIDELLVYYQPKIDIKSNKIVGVEALVRLKNKDGSLVPPNKFIPFAEKNGYINVIDRKVVEIAFRDIRSINDNMENEIKLSINLSPKDINWDMVEYIKEQIKTSGIKSSDIEIELTETAMLENIESVVEIFEYIRSLGISIAIDDFGKGFGALNYLRKFPISTIKIDKNFVDDINNNERGNKIIESIIALSKVLDINTIAEGVETENQLEYLETIECNEYQGFLCCKPIELDDFNELLKTRDS